MPLQGAERWGPRTDAAPVPGIAGSRPFLVGGSGQWIRSS